MPAYPGKKQRVQASFLQLEADSKHPRKTIINSKEHNTAKFFKSQAKHVRGNETQGGTQVGMLLAFGGSCQGDHLEDLTLSALLTPKPNRGQISSLLFQR